MTWAAIKALLGLVPGWCYWVLAVIVLCVCCVVYGEIDGASRGAAKVQNEWDQHEQQVKETGEAAQELRREQNRAQAAEQAAASAKIQKGHDDELAKVRADLRDSERLRLGAAWCEGAGAGGSPQAGSAGSGNGTGAAGRVLSPELDEAVKSLIYQAEVAAATARAAQAFIRENGMAPPAAVTP